MLTEDVLKGYLMDMPRGHIFDLPYSQFAQLYPPGEPDAPARDRLRQLADACGCDLVQVADEKCYEFIRR